MLEARNSIEKDDKGDGFVIQSKCDKVIEQLTKKNIAYGVDKFP